MDDDELTRLAEQELMREAKLGEARVAVHGVMALLRDKTPRTNKRFLSTTISNALQHNHRQRTVGNNASDSERMHKNEEILSKRTVLKRKEVTDTYPTCGKSDKKSNRTSHLNSASKPSKRTKSSKGDISHVFHRTKNDSRNEGNVLSNKKVSFQ